MNIRDLEGKVAIVTGGAQGIGRATVAELLGRGCRVCASDVQGEKVAGLGGGVGPWRRGVYGLGDGCDFHGAG